MSTGLAPELTIDRIDFADPRDAADLVAMLDVYARDPMGGGKPLDPDVAAVLPERLAETPGAFALIARRDNEAVGLATCFMTFSTFAARPVVNLHDIVVAPARRGEGIARTLFARIEEEARDRGACKVTLEVLSGNERAKAVYASLGYGDFVLDPKAGHALFWQKRL